MNTQLIVRRRMTTTPGSRHQHVGWVKLSNGGIFNRGQVFAYMRQGIKFETLSPQGHRARVIRVQCRTCAHDYLRTDRDQYKDDNLDMLPTF
jgi:Protein of unknown function (DUF3892)